MSMDGSIIKTDPAGGMIKPVAGGPTVRFSWHDCDDIHPTDVGHGTQVVFYIEKVAGRDRAIGVRRQRP